MENKIAINNDRTLRDTILRRVLPLTVLALFAIVAVTRYSMRKTVKNQVFTRLGQVNSTTAGALGRRFGLLQKSASDLAQNDLIVNSIIDRSQHSVQLAIFFRSLRLPSIAFERVTMTDYRGRTIASSGAGESDAKSPIDVSEFLDKVMAGDDHFEMNADQITMATPVLYGGAPEAVIAVRYDTALFMDEFQPADAAHRLRLLEPNSVIYDSHIDDLSDSTWARASHRVSGHPQFAVENSESIAIAFAPLNALDWLFTCLLVAFTTALFISIWKTTQISTKPLETLVRQISDIEARNDQTNRVTESGPLEFRRLASSFNSLLDSLSRTTVSRDRLKKSEDQMRTIVESVPNGILGTDSRGNISLVNIKLEQMFGFDRKELLGNPVEMLVPAPHRKTHQADRDAFSAAPEARAMAQLQALCGVHKSGKEIPVEIGLTPVQIEGVADVHLSVLASVVDVSERRRQEEYQERLRTQTQLILDSIPAVVIFKDTQNHILRINQAARSMMNIDLDADIEGKHSSNFFDEHEKYFADDLVVLNSGEPRIGIIEPVTTRDGVTRWASTDKIPIFDDDGAATGIVAVVSDITPVKEAEEALRQANRDLERSNSDLAQFAYVASHDLQEPLRKVTSFCSLLQEDCEDALSDEGKQFMAYVVDGATRMRTLIQDLLAYSRIDSASQSRSLVDTKSALETAIQNLSETIEESGARITYGDLPRVRADSVQLSQLLQNLVGNGIKYRRDVPPEIVVSAEEKESEWILSVQDNGIGIEPQYYEQVFGVFKRLHSADEYRGTGIGLAICERIVKRLDGKIWIESQLGEGTTFYVSIPKPGAKPS